MDTEDGGLDAGRVFRPEDVHCHAFADAGILDVKIGLDVRGEFRQLLRCGLGEGAKGGAEGEE